jgi:TonB-dependent SusC/RagA subfamily outer membrane receptor
MKRVYLLVALLHSIDLSAQDLADSRTSSFFTQVYQLSNQEVFSLYRKKGRSVPPEYFHTLVDFYPTDSIYRRKLPVGHYLFVKTFNDQLSCELMSVNNLNVQILNNNRDLTLIFQDQSGKEIKELKPLINHSKIPFDNKLEAFRIPKTNKRGWIAVEFEGHTNYFPFDRRYNNTFPKRTSRFFSTTFPFNHIISIFRYTYRSITGLIKYQHINPPGIYYRTRMAFDGKTYKGYLVTNKPMYKPGDTLKLKAFVTNRKGKPISKRLDIVLQNYSISATRDKKLGSIPPYRKGAYAFEFILHDSLKLPLDQSYWITLSDRNDNNYPSESFRFEQYELTQNIYKLRTSPSSKPNRPPVLLLRAYDTNDMPLYDVSATIVVKSMKAFVVYENNLFIPDTLWSHDIKLEPHGETTVVLPDSIYPNAYLEYKVDAIFTNSQNERNLQSTVLKYDKKEIIEMRLERDSVIFQSSEPGPYILLSLTQDMDTLSKAMVLLPYSEKIRPEINAYSLMKDKRLIKHVNLHAEDDQVQVVADRTPDSLFIYVQNPRMLPFRYQLFKNNRIEEAGYGQSYAVKTKTNATTRYYFSMQYLWAGKSTTKDYDLLFPKKPLTLEIGHEGQIYPGQSTDITIAVKDAFGKAVEDVDLTAYAITRKFHEYEKPSLPSFEQLKQRKWFNEFYIIKRTDQSIRQKLEYNFWRKKLGLDSINFYQFLYPDGGWYTNYGTATDSLTQVAPFVVKNGVIQPVFYIYFDRNLVYYHDVQTFTPYSFHATPGSSEISIRLRDQLVKINNVSIRKGQKLTLSIDIYNLPANVTVTSMPAKLTDKEISGLKPHFLSVARTADQSDAYLQQGNAFFLFQPIKTYYSDRLSSITSPQLTGPFYPGYIKFKSGFEVTFPFKTSMQYQFAPGLVDRQSHFHDYKRPLYGWGKTYSVKDQVLTEETIKQAWKASVESSDYIFIQPYLPNVAQSIKTGKLALRTPPLKAGIKPIAIFAINLQKPDIYYLFPPYMDVFSPLVEGRYNIIVVYNNQEYIKSESVPVRSFGITYLDLRNENLLAPDLFSQEVVRKVREWSKESHTKLQKQVSDVFELRQSYYTQPIDYASFPGGRWISGVVVSAEDGSPLPGVNVIVRGTTIGTVSDLAGYYRIFLPQDGALVFSFIGLQTQEVSTGGRSIIDVQLVADVTQLSEVVVTAMGMTNRKSLGYSVSTAEALQGRIAGVAVSGTPGAASFVRLRGITATSGQKPLVILDGEVVSIESVNESTIQTIEILKGDQAIALFGSRGANGVILISTKPGTTREQLLSAIPLQLSSIPGEQLAPGSSLRKNFRDYAFWQPRLRTGRNGTVKFQVTFPDDITGWNIYALGAASRKRLGSATSQVSAFKPIIAQLALPNFLIAGDHAFASGKLTNFTSDSLELTRTVSINDTIRQAEKLTLKNSHLDSVTIFGSGDSLSVQYEINLKGYRDGELRKIPVLPRGAKESHGFFAVLEKDTSFTFTPTNPISNLTIYAQADQFDVLLNEIEYLRNFRYECNEQLASKLKALLAEKSICNWRNEKFVHDRLVERIIRKLTNNQSIDGGWTWWGRGKSSVWITLHVAEALGSAEKHMYRVTFNKPGLDEYLLTASQGQLTQDYLKVWTYLTLNGKKVMAKSITDTLANQRKLYTNYYKLQAMRLRQLYGIEPDWNWINSIKQVTMKGNCYWGEERKSLWNNTIDNTLLVYQMLELKNPHDPTLTHIFNYFLEKRKMNWRNTYESSRIIDVLLPFLKNNNYRGKPELKLEGDVAFTINAFPFNTKLINPQVVHVSKTGSEPIYFTLYEEVWNIYPQPVSEDFTINTQWEPGNTKKLVTGKPVTLLINLTVKKDAEYVFIRVPIPAGCSYASRRQSKVQGEVYREYDFHETRIYCEYLKAGHYTYAVELLPRFKGQFTVNPASAEWMYFPVVYGRESPKQIHID